ncbi:MAG TPA: phosphate ABC transporter permease subunit PstC [Thermomicrobiales bacterium]|nr:phosphate ABC transporter permease subunit PstC [Thermomicrobiales bacterium]
MSTSLRAQRFGRRAIRERSIASILLLFAAISVFTTFGIVFVLLDETISFFQQVTFREYFTTTRWTPLFASAHFGIWPLINGTVLIAGIALLVAVPFGLGSAIYLAEFAPRNARAVLKPTLEILAGIPTVVYGYFALLFITPIIRRILPEAQVFNAMSAGIAMGIMIIPMVASLSEDAISAVPRSLHDGAAALGATRTETVLSVTLPAALSGIVASFILAMSRAIGETMIVAIAAGNQPLLDLTLNPLVGMQTMTAYIVQVSLGDTPQGTLQYSTIFAVGMTLFAITLVLNILSRIFVRKFREVYE